MHKIRMLAVALLSVVVLAQGATAAIAAPGDSELYRQGTCGDLGLLESRCDVKAGFKPGPNGGLDKTWLRVTVRYSIWINGTRRAQSELTITKSSTKDGNGFYGTSRLHIFGRFQPCDEIEIRWAEAPIIGEDPTTLKDAEQGKFRARQDSNTKPGPACSGIGSGLSVSVMLPADAQDAGDEALLASNGATEPSPPPTGGAVQPA